jgi:hypothetical protein
MRSWEVVTAQIHPEFMDGAGDLSVEGKSTSAPGKHKDKIRHAAACKYAGDFWEAEGIFLVPRMR